jgi:hypothetical protein
MQSIQEEVLTSQSLRIGGTAMSILVQRYHRRIRLLQEMLEDWQIKHQQAMFARDLEELVQECLELRRLTDHVWGKLSDGLFSEEIENIDPAGRLMQFAVDKAVEVFEQIATLIRKADEGGYNIDASDDFSAAQARIKEIKTELAVQWPWSNHDLIQESLAAYKRGEHRTAEEMLRELEVNNPRPN